LQHGAGGGFDGLLFAGADGVGIDAALWWSDSAATGESVVAAGRGGWAELAARAAGAARAARNFTNRSGFSGAGHAFDAGFVWPTAIGNQITESTEEVTLKTSEVLEDFGSLDFGPSSRFSDKGAGQQVGIEGAGHVTVGGVLVESS
jgi:hypothetical protein